MKIQKEEFFTKNSTVILPAVAATLLWGSAFPCVKIGYDLFAVPDGDSFSQILFAGLRFTLAGLLCLCAACIKNKRLVRLSPGALPTVTMLGLVHTSIQYFFFYIGLAHTTGVKASILNAAGVFITIILARIFYKSDKITMQKALGCIIGFSGIILINFHGLQSGDFTFKGDGFIILATVASAFGSVLSKQAVQKDSDAVTVSGFQFLIGGVLLIASAIITGGRIPQVSPAGILMLFYMAGISSVAFSIWTMLLKYNNVGKIAVYKFLIPIFGALLSAVFLREKNLNAQTVIALGLVCAGIFTAYHNFGKVKADRK